MIQYLLSSCREVFLFNIVCVFLYNEVSGQCVPCAATTFNVDLSGAIDTTYTIQSVRSGDCCTGTNCIRFNIIINPGSNFVNFSVANPAPNGAAYYQINCGPQTSLGTPACVSGMTNVCITYCKPGNDNPTYTLTTAATIRGSGDIALREGCSGVMSVIGLQPATITWTSISPGATGDYNSFLSCVTGCTSTTVTPQAGAPAYIDYKVTGNKVCTGLGTDTVRVYTVPMLGVAISPFNPTVCNSQSTTLTAIPTGGAPPYSFVWSNGQTTPSISVSSVGNYTVTVSDSTMCAPVSKTITVSQGVLPTTPTASNNGPLCEGATLSLSANAVAGATYNWTGPNGFTSSLQNPVIINATTAATGNYIVTASINGCTNTAGATTTVTVNAYPSMPTPSSNSPVCVGTSLLLNTPGIAGASYSWTGPNGFTSTNQNPVINNVTLSDAGSYSLTVTVNGCTSAAGSVNVSVNPIPATPVAGSNSPVCSGTALNLTANTIAGATYNWTGPNGFASTIQDPVINNVGPATAGMYNVTATVNGCTSTAGVTTVIINPAPAAPVASNNGPLCVGQALNLNAGTISSAAYSWTGPNGFTSVMQNPVIANTTLADTGTYYVSAIVNGCASMAAPTTVIIRPVAVAPVINSNSPVCEGDTLLLNTPFIAGIAYSWTGPNAFTSNLQSPVINNISLSQGGSYTLTVTGCTTASNTAAVIIKPLPSTPVTNNNGPVCIGQTLGLTASSTTGAMYTWTGPNSFSSSQQNPLITNISLTDAGIYYVSAIDNGCKSSTATTVVTVNMGPIVNAGADKSVIENQTVVLSPVVNGTNMKYLWTPNVYLNSDTIKNPVVTGKNDQLYTLKVTDISGCSGEDDVLVKVLREIKIPNTFTPNNDGVNDVWIIKNLEDYPDCHMQIFNRYGQLVFESKGYLKAWNGTYKGRSLPFGTYYYIVEPGSGSKIFTGYVTIIK